MFEMSWLFYIGLGSCFAAENKVVNLPLIFYILYKLNNIIICTISPQININYNI